MTETARPAAGPAPVRRRCCAGAAREARAQDAGGAQQDDADAESSWLERGAAGESEGVSEGVSEADGGSGDDSRSSSAVRGLGSSGAARGDAGAVKEVGRRLDSVRLDPGDVG